MNSASAKTLEDGIKKVGIKVISAGFCKEIMKHARHSLAVTKSNGEKL